jgi:hypothetical protein
MAKYDPLRDYLRRQRAAAVEMSFVEIERKLGYMLPKSANFPHWWDGSTNDDRRQVQRQAWAEAGYAAVLNLGGDSVTFTRIVRS